MKRLTEKLNKYLYSLDCLPSESDSYTFEAIQKLGKLEDLEEDLGMPLDYVAKYFKVYQQALIFACREISEYDNKGTNSREESQLEWYNSLIKRAEKALEVMKNEKEISL